MELMKVIGILWKISNGLNQYINLIIVQDGCLISTDLLDFAEVNSTFGEFRQIDADIGD